MPAKKACGFENRTPFLGPAPVSYTHLSVRADLEPVPACASLMYSALAVLAFFAKDGPYVSMTYGVDAPVLALSLIHI